MLRAGKAIGDNPEHNAKIGNTQIGGVEKQLDRKFDYQPRWQGAVDEGSLLENNSWLDHRNPYIRELQKK